MERNREFRELVQKEKEKLENEEIFESAFYRQMLLCVAGEMTGGTLKRVELVKKPDETSGAFSSCESERKPLFLLFVQQKSLPQPPPQACGPPPDSHACLPGNPSVPARCGTSLAASPFSPSSLLNTERPPLHKEAGHTLWKKLCRRILLFLPYRPPARPGRHPV